MKDNKNTTPVMKQFWDTKKQYPDSILLFRMGDFYETFDQDAKITSEVLGITLTKRANGAAAAVPLAGFPYHSLNQHLYKLLDSGYKVAVCEQVEDPKQASRAGGSASGGGTDEDDQVLERLHEWLGRMAGSEDKITRK